MLWKTGGLKTQFVALYHFSNAVFSHAFSSNIKHFFFFNTTIWGSFYKQLHLSWKNTNVFYLRYSSHFLKLLSTETKNLSFGLVNIWVCRSKTISRQQLCTVLNLELALVYQICKYLYPPWLSKLFGSAEMIGLFWNTISDSLF